MIDNNSLSTTMAQLSDLVRRIGSELSDAEMPLQCALIFLLIAKTGDSRIDQGRLAKETGLSTSSVSRHVRALSKLNRFRKPGLDLVETRTNQSDWRVKPIFLNEKGKTVVRSLGKQ